MRPNNYKVFAKQALRLLGVALLSVACASVLGIETTKRTNRAAAGYGSGYEGCRRNSCNDCLTPVHKTSCQGPAGYGSGYEGCRAGDCSQCQAAHVDECEGAAGWGAEGYEGCTEGVCDQCLTLDHRCRCNILLPGCLEIIGDSGVNNGPGSCEAGADCSPGEGGTGPLQCRAPACNGCETTSEQCLCLGNSVDECLTAVLEDECEPHFTAENDACHTCSCSACSSELLGCLDDPESACMMLARCINIHGCSGEECNTPDTCGPLLAGHGGINGSSFQMATALAQCQGTGECPCTHEPTTAGITCPAVPDDLQCAAFVGGDADAGGDSLPACCFEQGGPHCGLDVTGVLFSGCEPRGLSGSPASVCPGLQTKDEFPYFGAFLPGCCRPTSNGSAMNGGPGVCGYNDTVTGLKCMPTEKITGMSTTPISCTYVR